ncbi:MAG TPA: hypothetical protein VMU48_19975 [Terracidiphilus sp.]|nr:hypothetical protein [Terracidiphilus sp.]
MVSFNLKSLAVFRVAHGPANGKKLTVGLLRIASIPSDVRPERSGAVQQEWLTPIALSNNGK